MPKSHPFSAFPMIGEAWQFFWKQPALLPVTILLIGMPNWLVSTMTRLVEPGGILTNSTPALFLQANDPKNFAVMLAGFLLFLATIWGMAGVLVVGRRMIGARSGRARTSFSSVTDEASEFVRPMFFTMIFVAAAILLWLLLPIGAVALGMYLNVFHPLSWIQRGIVIVLCVPAIICAIRLSFTLLAIPCEEPLMYRSAMKRSKELVSGRFWNVVWCLVAFSAVLALAPSVLGVLLEAYVLQPWMLMGGDLVIQILAAIGGAIYLLAMVLLYGKLRDAPREVRM